MQSRHKLRKIFSAGGVQSALEHARRLTQPPIDVRKILRSLPSAELELLRKQYLERAQTDDAVPNSAKFLDAEYWIRVNVERAKDLQLQSGKPLRILDLGCGAGYFLYVCEQLGHEAVGLDLDENPIYTQTVALLGVRRVIWRVEPFLPLPDLDGKFDLVAAHCICFQKLARSEDGEWSQWGPAEWEFFLQDVRTRVLSAEGRLMLDFNPRDDGSYYPPAVEATFRASGGRCFRSKVLFSNE